MMVILDLFQFSKEPFNMLIDPSLTWESHDRIDPSLKVHKGGPPVPRVVSICNHINKLNLKPKEFFREYLTSKIPDIVYC